MVLLVLPVIPYRLLYKQLVWCGLTPHTRPYQTIPITGAYQGYDHAIRRGASRALTWTFLLDVVLVNSFLLQLHGQPHWKRYTNQKDWRRRIHNDLSPECV
jgi:hypothetical protein